MVSLDKQVAYSAHCFSINRCVFHPVTPFRRRKCVCAGKEEQKHNYAFEIEVRSFFYSVSARISDLIDRRLHPTDFKTCSHVACGQRICKSIANTHTRSHSSLQVTCVPYWHYCLLRKCSDLLSITEVKGQIPISPLCWWMACSVYAF